MTPIAQPQFEILKTERKLGDYDYGSIMHYGENAFAAGDKPTITLKHNFAGKIGQRDDLSAGDRAALVELYKNIAIA